MRIYSGIDEFKRIKYPVVTAGTFDGVHLGHQKIIRKLGELARSKSGETVILTFWPHPRYVLKPGSQLKLLTTFQEKALLLESLGIDHLIRLPFTQKFSQITSQQYLEQVLVKQLGTKQLVIGYDHRFGKNREGSFEYLKANAAKYGFEVVEIPRKDIDQIAVSSTKIRENIMNDRIDEANKLLGRFFQISGKVIPGQQLGRIIGFPTANIEIAEDYKLIPSDGAYAVMVTVDQKVHHGMMNIGYKPTVGSEKRTIEIHIFDFDQDIYHHEVAVGVVKQIRPEIKFRNTDELTSRLKQDDQEARALLKKYSLDN